MLTNILHRFGYRRHRRDYRPWAGGGLLSLAALLGWLKRARLRQFFRDRFGAGPQDPMMRGGPAL
jgi:hypothetical protein